MRIWQGLAFAGVLLASCGEVQAADGTSQRPNIFYIMADDHAAHAISAYGSKLTKTPNIDRIASAGMRFDLCLVTNSICTPSRASIITGKYSHLNGVPVFNHIDGSQPTLPKYLQAAGYHTGMIGKWHLGTVPTGFTYWNILPGQGLYGDPILIEQGSTQEAPWLRDRHHHRSLNRVSRQTPQGQAVLSHEPPQGTASSVGAGREACQTLREGADTRAGDLQRQL
jgi:arylsulfatase A-like enzyme